ncbi:hypothetical protein BHR41_21885 [Aeromonas salmonicida subsp. salmonicida]|nr:hypothetical protein BHR41_21885 [Aeromonas salmonicida subsp. salmonicida]OKB09198.1 hypothetical protein ASJ31_21915 [Aeromonas salmonicida subsp. salmonicida]
MAQFGFQAADLGLQGRLFELLVSGLVVLLEPGIQAVAGDPKGSCNVSHRPSALGDLLNRFDFECFWITLTGHNTSNGCLILRL